MNRFRVHYRLRLFDGETIDERLGKICREQSAELPADVISDFSMNHVTGVIVEKNQENEQYWSAKIDWPHLLLDDDISQFTNVLFGNISLMPGNRITAVEWNTLPSDLLNGPKFGISGIRERYEIPERALSCTALKPIGFSTGKLARMCYEFARGGIDIIKDDHGLTNQQTARFEDRVSACNKAVQRAAEKTGRQSFYYPNITATPDETLRRIEFAARSGCEGVLFCPHISGLPLLHELKKFGLPIMAHPSFSGQLVMNPNHGFTPEFLYGSLWRAFGADFVIYPNAGGRFSFSEQTCHALNHEARKPSEAAFNSSWPTPGGGIQRDSIPYWLQSYGSDTVFLAGGSLYQHSGGIEIAAKEFTEMLTQ